MPLKGLWDLPYWLKTKHLQVSFRLSEYILKFQNAYEVPHSSFPPISRYIQL